MTRRFIPSCHLCSTRFAMFFTSLFISSQNFDPVGPATENFTLIFEKTVRHLGADRAILLNFQIIRSKTGWYFALERLFHSQNGRCKILAPQEAPILGRYRCQLFSQLTLGDSASRKSRTAPEIAACIRSRFYCAQGHEFSAFGAFSLCIRI